MIALLLSAAIQIAAPVEAECVLTADGMTRRNSPPTALSVDCPDDVVDAAYLQQVADYAVGLIPLEFSGNIWSEIIPSVWFEWTPESSWTAIVGQQVINIVPMGSPRLVERGYRSQACSYAVWPDERGLSAEPQVYCLADGEEARNVIRHAQRSMLDAIENMRFLPVEVRYCFQDETFVTMSVIGERSYDPVAPPELPLLCEADN